MVPKQVRILLFIGKKRVVSDNIILQNLAKMCLDSIAGVSNLYSLTVKDIIDLLVSRLKDVPIKDGTVAEN